MKHQPEIAAEIAVLDPPSDEELTISVAEARVLGQASERGGWIVQNGEKYEHTEGVR